MELAKLEFHRAFLKLASPKSLEVGSLSESEPVPVHQDRVEFDPSSLLISPAMSEAQRDALARQSLDSAIVVAATLAPGTVVNLAVVAAMQVTDQAVEVKDAHAFGGLLESTETLQSHPEIQSLWERLRPHLAVPLKEPVLTRDSQVREGLHAGQQIFLNPSYLSDPDETLFILAHEAAHAELRHGVRSAGLREAERYLGRGNAEGPQALEQARWALEVQADVRAAQLSSLVGIDPLKVLKTLLLSKQDREHPDGTSRAVAAKDQFSASGVKVSDSEWERLLEETAEVRARHAEHLAKERAFHAALKKFS